VVPGAGRGRTIGIPTLNLAPPSPRKLLPPDGVYAVRVNTWATGPTGPTGPLDGMANLGPRPTFGDSARSLEAHLLDFEGDLYGRDVTVEFIERLRDVQKFASVEELRARLALDREAAIAALRKPARPVTL
jgi:riboflavin kinase/FMN adenylyltransferase